MLRYDLMQSKAVMHSTNIERSNRVNLRVDDNSNPIDVLQRVVAFTPVLSAQLSRPSLDEIFIEQVASSRGVEAAEVARMELDNA